MNMDKTKKAAQAKKTASQALQSKSTAEQGQQQEFKPRHLITEYQPESFKSGPKGDPNNNFSRGKPQNGQFKHRRGHNNKAKKLLPVDTSVPPPNYVRPLPVDTSVPPPDYYKRVPPPPIPDEFKKAEVGPRVPAMPPPQMPYAPVCCNEQGYLVCPHGEIFYLASSWQPYQDQQGLVSQMASLGFQ